MTSLWKIMKLTQQIFRSLYKGTGSGVCFLNAINPFKKCVDRVCLGIGCVWGTNKVFTILWNAGENSISWSFTISEDKRIMRRTSKRSRSKDVIPYFNTRISVRLIKHNQLLKKIKTPNESNNETPHTLHNKLFH